MYIALTHCTGTVTHKCFALDMYDCMFTAPDALIHSTESVLLSTPRHPRSKSSYDCLIALTYSLLT